MLKKVNTLRHKLNFIFIDTFKLVWIKEHSEIPQYIKPNSIIDKDTSYFASPPVDLQFIYLSKQTEKIKISIVAVSRFLSKKSYKKPHSCSTNNCGECKFPAF